MNPCTGHPCDDCVTCRRGRCCRRDNPSYQLPSLGEWDGQVNGALGIKNVVGDSVECHACGDFFKSVATHAWYKHDLTALEYKSIFGLAFSTNMFSPTANALMRKNGQVMYRENKLDEHGPPSWTPEQLAQRRRMSLETRMRLQMSRKPPSVEKLCACGKEFVVTRLRKVFCSRECQARYLTTSGAASRRKASRARTMSGLPHHRAKPTTEVINRRASGIRRAWESKSPEQRAQSPDHRANIAAAVKKSWELRRSGVTVQ